MRDKKASSHDDCVLIKRDEHIENYHYQELDESYRITKPTIICLGGNCTLKTKDANAMCKIAQRLIGLKKPTGQNEHATTSDVDLLGVKYGFSYNKYGKRLDTSELSFKDVSKLTNQLLAPLVFENGQKLDVLTACKNISNVTFLSHSIGTKQVGKMISHLIKSMLEGGYTKEETSQVIEGISSVAYAPETTISSYFAQIKMSKWPTPQQFNIKSIKDPPADVEYQYETGKSYHSLNGVELVRAKHNPNEITLYVDNFKTYSNSAEHMIHSVIHRSEKWESISWEKDTEGNHYFVSDKADAASQCAGYILASSVANAFQNRESENYIPKPTTHETIETCKDIISQFENIPYQES